jgi:prepilin-type N-terminal cleavage/methylation domain-containing protein
MKKSLSGFTLIELSIVLVIIGLIVGGVLVGQDLIKAAYVRAQISQIEKFNTAVNTFYGKYQALPGDMNATIAQANGFVARGVNPAEGDGNGIIQSNTCDQAGLPGCVGSSRVGGESSLFWSDLTYANGQNLNLIQGSFPHPVLWGQGNPSITGWGQVFPTASIGGGNYVYVDSGGVAASGATSNGINYYTISVPIVFVGYGDFSSNTGMTVKQAYDIDRKIDDGMPTSGRVTAWFQDCCGTSGVNGFVWAGTGGNSSSPFSLALSPSVTSCFDNGGNINNPAQYSTGYNGGNAANCALSFQFQSGD